MSRLAITTSSGRRVSMLCEDDGSYFHNYASSPSPSSCPPLSPDYTRPSGSERSDSFCSTASSAYSNGPLTPSSPNGLCLPPLEKLMSLDSYPKNVCAQDSTSTTSSSPHLAARSASLASTQSDETGSSDSTNLPVKRLTRKYTCHCNKSFTTSGHLARHSRIHTGEKNYACPESTCGARFSRQDNCMQHYRTHQSGTSNKRTARKKRVEAPVVVADSPRLAAHMHKYYSEAPFSAEDGLSALANVAISGYP